MIRRYVGLCDTQLQTVTNNSRNFSFRNRYLGQNVLAFNQFDSCNSVLPEGQFSTDIFLWVLIYSMSTFELLLFCYSVYQVTCY